jgi:ABC-type uncharacterized transport system auxiliary subunit
MMSKPLNKALKLFAATALLLALAGCASVPTGPGVFSFAVIGDQQYDAREEELFLEMREHIN